MSSITIFFKNDCRTGWKVEVGEHIRKSSI